MMDSKKDYRPRIVDKLLSENLKAFGGVLITGPKMCGKTWTGLNQAASSIFLDDEDNIQRALLTPELVLEGENPRLIDEWQLTPKLWDKARRSIDKKHKSGLYIFTGSAVPASETMHTGTGRFTHMKMRPMSLFESGDSTGAISLSTLFDGKPIEPIDSDIDFTKIIHLICRGGWPATLWVDESSALKIPQGYLEMIIESDISRIDGINRNSAKVRLLIRSLARNTATMAGSSTLLGDICENESQETISMESIDNYLNALRQIFIIEDQQAWLPSMRSRTRIRTSPKRHFIDPSLSAAAMGASPELLIKDPKTTGFLFESLCYRDLSVYAGAIDGKVYHYHDEKDLEADSIIQLDDGRWAAVESKLGSFEFDDAAGHLLRLKEKMKANAGEPSFLMIMTATGGVAFTRKDGVHVVPVDRLGI
jgi:predicted AAA+ superfamily ATPase